MKLVTVEPMAMSNTSVRWPAQKYAIFSSHPSNEMTICKVKILISIKDM